MNAEQLWETTLDPNVRSLLQVKVTDATDADGLFARLAPPRFVHSRLPDGIVEVKGTTERTGPAQQLDGFGR